MKDFYKQRNAWLYVSPALILYTVFTILPLPVLIYTAMQKHNSIKVLDFVGIRNFIDVFRDKIFWGCHLRTYALLAVSLLIGIPLALLMALLTDRAKPWLRNLFKFAIVLPSVLSVTVIAQLYKGFLDPDRGIVNTLLRLFGKPEWALSWLGRSDTALVSIVAIGTLFGGGLTVIFFYAGIKAIPPQYYEAASIDGANFWQASRKITIPMIQDIRKYILVTSVVGAMTAWEIYSLMGGPSKSCWTVLIYIIRLGFADYNFGYCCAAAFIYFIECVIVAFIVNKLTDKEPLEF